MIKIKQLRIYTGHLAWGWYMYGIGYGTYWFFGYSKNVTNKGNL